MAALDVRDLRKTYGDQAVVAGLSFAVEPGTCFGLLGPNGAGKTTLVRSLLQKLDPARVVAIAAGIGYPLILKAAGGGGGRGHRRRHERGICSRLSSRSPVSVLQSGIDKTNIKPFW